MKQQPRITLFLAFTLALAASAIARATQSRISKAGHTKLEQSCNYEETKKTKENGSLRGFFAFFVSSWLQRLSLLF